MIKSIQQLWNMLNLSYPRSCPCKNYQNDCVVFLTHKPILFATFVISQGLGEEAMRFPLPFGYTVRYISLSPMQLVAVIYVSSCQ